MKMKIALIPGDGIGPEVAEQAVEVLQAVAQKHGHTFEFERVLMGGVAIRKFGTAMPEETLRICLAADAVFLGAVGDPEFDTLPAGQRPESALLLLRKSLGGFANLRPAVCHKALVDCSPLRPEIVSGADILIVRELLGGAYFGEPRGFVEGRSAGYNTISYTAKEIERVTRIAFEIARGRKRKLTSVDKANILEVSQLWREVVNKVAADYPDVALQHLYVDACSMRLITHPTSFDVILTENLFGDILSDEASVMTGSLGMLGSATIGGTVDLYEPVHGTAPDIAGRGIANPLGAIASAAMLLRYTAKLEREADEVEDAISTVLAAGCRTHDLVGSREHRVVSTSEMGELVRQALIAVSQGVAAK